MKIFGKRQIASKEADNNLTTTYETTKIPNATENQNQIPSYFSRHSNDDNNINNSNKNESNGPNNHGRTTTTTSNDASKKSCVRNGNNKYTGEDIMILLSMEEAKLNSKQRRLVRRHRERQGKDDVADTATAAKEDGFRQVVHTEESTTNMIDETIDAIGTTTCKETKSTGQSQLPLLGINAKERRKLLRQQQQQPQQQLSLQDGMCHKHDNVSPERKNTALGKDDEQSTSKSSNRRKRKNQAVCTDNLAPEEVARREQQRQMQKEAAERRSNVSNADSCNIDESGRHHRRPLNSERRRANRRKPGKAGWIAMAKRAAKERSSNGAFNEVGYQMRKERKKG